MNASAFRSIVVGTDLSEASDPVLRTAGALASLADAELHVVHVVELPLLPYAEANVGAAAVDVQTEQAETTLREQLRRALPPRFTPASAEVLVRPVHQALTERAAEVEADLIVLGPHRLRPFGDRFLGSTADRVIRTAAVPCLLVRRPLELPLRRVLLPTDLSEHAGTALDVALAWVRALGARPDDAGSGAELEVIHVIPRAYEMPNFAFDEEIIAPELERIVAAALARAEAEGATTVREAVTWGDLPADEILSAAAAQNADLLVIGTHGHGAVRRALLGSVATTVARGAPCSVLLVPPPRERVKP